MSFLLQEDVPTYDPQKYVENAPVLRTLNLEPPAVRAAFRESERRRLNQLTMKAEKWFLIVNSPFWWWFDLF